MLYLLIGSSVILLIMLGCLLDKAKKDIRYAQNHDQITGLMKEEYFIEKVDQLIKGEDELRYSILSVDIDRFRYISSVYGYENGQQIIQAFVEYFDKWSTCILLAARTGMDSFVLLLRTVDVDIFIEDFVIAENSITARSGRIMGEKNVLGYSVGIYDMKDGSRDCKTMIDCAYFARVHGHSVYGRTSNQYTYLMEQSANKVNEITFQMAKAMENGNFKIVYSNINEVEHPDVTKVFRLNQLIDIDVIATVRWERGDKILHPREFIRIFEKNGFIEKLDYYKIEKICADIKECGTTGTVATRISGVTLSNTFFCEDIRLILEKYNVHPSQLNLRLTEGALLEWGRGMREQIMELREAGFQLSLDDSAVIENPDRSLFFKLVLV